MFKLNINFLTFIEINIVIIISGDEMLYTCNKVNFIVLFVLLLIVMIQVLILKPTSVIQSNSYFQAFSPSSSYKNPESERKYRRKLNLVEETPEKIEECTLGRLYHMEFPSISI